MRRMSAMRIMFIFSAKLLEIFDETVATAYSLQRSVVFRFTKIRALL